MKKKTEEFMLELGEIIDLFTTLTQALEATDNSMFLTDIIKERMDKLHEDIERYSRHAELVSASCLRCVHD